jgi:hypothetical protein
VHPAGAVRHVEECDDRPQGAGSGELRVRLGAVNLQRQPGSALGYL